MNIQYLMDIENITDTETLLKYKEYLLSTKSAQDAPKRKINIILPDGKKGLKKTFDFINPYALDKEAKVKYLQSQNNFEQVYAIANQIGIEEEVQIPISKEEKHQRVITPIQIHAQLDKAA